MKKTVEVEEYIGKASKNQQEILSQLRDLIFENVPEAVEGIKWGQAVFSTSKNFCYLKINKAHINLGFFNFDILSDPNNLLQGSGKQMRHIKIYDLNNFDLEKLGNMMRQAAKDK